MKQAGQPIEVVFVSADREKGSFQEYLSGHHPWLAIPFDSPTRQNTSQFFKVSGIPALIIFAPVSAKLPACAVHGARCTVLQLGCRPPHLCPPIVRLQHARWPLPRCSCILRLADAPVARMQRPAHVQTGQIVEASAVQAPLTQASMDSWKVKAGLMQPPPSAPKKCCNNC